MSYSLNRAEIIGNLTRDPEMRTTGTGIAVTSFSLATNQTWKDQNGQMQTKTEYHNIVAWRRLAEIVHQYARKGSKIFVEGKLQTSEWTGEDGIKRYRTEIVADNVILLDSKGGGSDQGSYNQERSYQPMSNNQPENNFAQASAPAEEVALEDLPF